MIQKLPKSCLPIMAATLLAAPLTASLFAVPKQNNGAKQKTGAKHKANVKKNADTQQIITDPDAANAPIADRETFGSKAKETRPIPNLAEIGVPRTNYPIPKEAIFVAPEGDANASGLDRNTPTTLQHAIESAPVGGTIILKGGEYRGVPNLKINRQMTLQAAPGETVWIKGSVIVSGFVPESSALPRWSVAWDKKLTHPKPQDLDKNNPIAGETDMVFIDGRSLQQVTTLDEVKPGTFLVDTAAKKLVLGSNPEGKVVESTVDETGLEIKGKAAWGTQVRGLGFAHFAQNGMEAFGHQLLLENNTFAWNAARGLSLHDDDNVLRGNIFACNGLTGLAGSRTNNLLFENNQVLFNNIEGFRPTWSAAGTKLVMSKNMTLRNNIYEYNQAAALWLDISCINTNIIGNTVRHNKGLGVFYELCHGGVVGFNVMQDNGVGLMLSDATSIRAWNNTFLDNAKAVAVKDTPRFNDPSKTEGFYKTKVEDIALGATWIAANNEFHNNLFVGGRNEKTVLVDAGPAGKMRSSGDMISALDHNVYARTAPDLPRLLVRWHENGNQTDFDSLETLRAAHTKYEANGTFINNSPLVDTKTYRLVPKSPLLSLGTELPADVRELGAKAGIALPLRESFVGAFGSAVK